MNACFDKAATIQSSPTHWLRYITHSRGKTITYILFHVMLLLIAIFVYVARSFKVMQRHQETRMHGRNERA
jgi:hypothetical protein